jgi:hypothetical protein
MGRLVILLLGVGAVGAGLYFYLKSAQGEAPPEAVLQAPPIERANEAGKALQRGAEQRERQAEEHVTP